jgi:hypothetical protein
MKRGDVQFEAEPFSTACHNQICELLLSVVAVLFAWLLCLADTLLTVHNTAVVAGVGWIYSYSHTTHIHTQELQSWSPAPLDTMQTCYADIKTNQRSQLVATMTCQCGLNAGLLAAYSGLGAEQQFPAPYVQLRACVACGLYALAALLQVFCELIGASWQGQDMT